MNVLQEADAIAGNDRSRDYGHPRANHERIAGMWTIQLGKKLKPGERIEPDEVALMMIALKLARLINSPKRDSVVDIAGYAKCWEMIVE